MEAWYPGTVWNPNGTSIAIYSDWEATIVELLMLRLAAATISSTGNLRAIVEERRQATVMVLREADQDT